MTLKSRYEKVQILQESGFWVTGIQIVTAFDSPLNIFTWQNETFQLTPSGLKCHFLKSFRVSFKFHKYYNSAFLLLNAVAK